MLETKPLASGATTVTTISGNAGGRATNAADSIALSLRKSPLPTLRREASLLHGLMRLGALRPPRAQHRTRRSPAHPLAPPGHTRPTHGAQRSAGRAVGGVKAVRVLGVAGGVEAVAGRLLDCYSGLRAGIWWSAAPNCISEQFRTAPRTCRPRPWQAEHAAERPHRARDRTPRI